MRRRFRSEALPVGRGDPIPDARAWKTIPRSKDGSGAASTNYFSSNAIALQLVTTDTSVEARCLASARDVDL